MNKTILIYVVLLTIYSYEATNSSEPNDKEERCISPYALAPDRVYCGTDGLDYHYLSEFECIQKSKYGKRINLQLRHRGGCWIWEKNGFETYEVICVSKFEVEY